MTNQEKKPYLFLNCAGEINDNKVKSTKKYVLLSTNFERLYGLIVKAVPSMYRRIIN